jgi:RimJ/RimL family protein N-acetyltransferase
MTELPDLQGACVLLQPLRETHAAALFRVLRDPELWRFMDDAPPTSEAALAERYRRLESRRSPDNLQYWLNWAIVVPTEVIGFVQATVTNEAADIAYVIGREYVVAWPCNGRRSGDACLCRRSARCYDRVCYS